MGAKKDNYSANYDGFSLVSGGLIYRIMAMFLKSKDPLRNRRQRALLFALVAWIPLGILALLIGPQSFLTNEISFLKDFEIHVRFLFAVPFLILIERMVDHSFIEYIKTSDQLIDHQEQPGFNKLVLQVDKLSNLYLPEVLMLVIIYLSIFMRWNDPSLFDSSKSYLTNHDGSFTTAGVYYLFVSLPIFQLLLFRWFWRWIIWVYSLLRISRFTF